MTPSPLCESRSKDRRRTLVHTFCLASFCRSKNYPAGHRRVDEVLQKQPNSAVGYYLRGKLYLAEEKFDLAQTALLKAIDLDPNLSPAYDLLMPAFLHANNLPEALNQMNA